MITRRAWIQRAAMSLGAMSLGAPSLGALVLSAMACDAGPRALVVGQDSCRFCRMAIDDVRFGALVVTSRGKVETFDSIECLASYVRALPRGERPRGVWVANFDAPTEWIVADSARFLQHSNVRSPMGRELAAFAPRVPVDSLVSLHGGTALQWSDVTALVAQRVGAP